MKQKIMICAGSQCFEFIGDIIEEDSNYIFLRAKHGDIYIERKYLVFIQFLNNEASNEEQLKQQVNLKNSKLDQAKKFVNNQLKHDPINQSFDEHFIPPSQLSDNEEDNEAMRQVMRHYNKSYQTTQPENLVDAIRNNMNNEDFSVGGNVEYADVSKTILRLKNASAKKSGIS